MLDINAKGIAGIFIAIAVIAVPLMIYGSFGQSPELLSLGVSFGIVLVVLAVVVVAIWGILSYRSGL